MSNLIKVSDLQGPKISGTVNVSLSELDQMRTDHAHAIKLAKALEETQMKVVIVYQERKTYEDFDRGSRFPTTRTVKEEINREYKNLDEIRDVIAKEEFTKLENKITTLQNDLDKTRQDKIEYSNRLLDANTKVTKSTELLKEANEHVESLTIELKKTEEIVGLQNENIAVLRDSIKILEETVTLHKVKRGFWYNIYYYLTH
jgi:chromosome segregation ATPase